MDAISQLSFDYNTCFKNIYYELYSNSNTSRAERIVSDITKVLLCKLAAEENGITNISELSRHDLLQLIRKKYPTSCDQFDDFSLDSRSITRVLSLLENISLRNAPSHIIGDAFQAIMGPRIRGEKGQFFTPKELVECMVRIVGLPKSGLIVDPACGTGGFLTEAFSVGSHTNPTAIPDYHLFGIDKDKDMADMALATTEIISHGQSSVYCRNSLEIIDPNNELHYLIGSADIILTNPPFGAKIGVSDEKILKYYEFGYNWTYSELDKTWYKLNTLAKNQAPQILFLELCVRMLKSSGKMAIVLPEGIWGNKSLGYIWDYLKKHGKVFAMLDCPRNTFQPSTDTKTNVLFFEKGTEYSDHSLVAVAKNCGHDKRGRVTSSNNTPIPNDYAILAEDYHKPSRSLWKTVTLSGAYFVPRYLAGRSTRPTSPNYITIGEMIEQHFLIRKNGKEVGSESYGTGAIPFVRTSDIINFEISADPTNAVSEEVYQQYAPQQNLEIGDILFIADGRYRIGKTAIITQYNYKCLIQSHIEILSLTKDAPLSPYELLYCLNQDEVQEQIRSLVFIQSTLGTIGSRILEIAIRIPERTHEWNEKMLAFQHYIEMRAEYLSKLQEHERSFDL